MSDKCVGQRRPTNLNSCTFPWSCFGLERHYSARGTPGRDMMYLAQFSISVAQYAEVELIVFRRFAEKYTFLDR